MRAGRRVLGLGAVMAVLAGVLAAGSTARAGGATRVTAATPTVFFRDLGGGRLAQQADITLDQKAPAGTTVAVTLHGTTLQSAVGAGATAARVDVPDTTTPGTATFSVVGGGAPRDVPWKPQRKWDVWLQPSSHVDQYSTSNAAYTPEEHARAVETALQLIATHPDFRFQVEEGREVEDFKRLRPNEWDQFVAAVRSGHMAVGAQYTGYHHDEASDESTVQGQYGYDGMQSIYDAAGFRPDAGITYDMPGLGQQVPQVLARQGVKYQLWAPNHSYALYERMHLPWLFRWMAPDGSSVLTWRAAWNYGYEKNQYYDLQGSTQDAAEQRMNQMLLDRQDGIYHDPYGQKIGGLVPPYQFSDLLVIWDYGDNGAATAEPIDLVHRWDAKWAYPRFRMGTFGEFMDHMSTAYDQSQIPTISGGAADAWTYVVTAQGLINEFTRRAERQLPAAATWCSLAGLLGGPQCDNAKFHEAWQDVGMTEAHDWFYGTIAGDVIVKQQTGQQVPDTGLPLPFNMGQGRVPDFMVPDLDKANWGRGSEAIGSSLLSSGTQGFAGLLASQGDDVAVLNNGTATRSDLVVIPATDRHVVDEDSGDEIPTQRISAADWATSLGARPVMAVYANADVQTQPRNDVTVFVAPDVPGLGYKRFRLSTTPGRPGRPPAPSPYQLGFDPATGALSSIVDRRDGRQLIDQNAKWKLGELLVGQPATDAGDIFDTPQPIKDHAQQVAAQSMSTVVAGYPGAAAPPQCGAVLCETRVVGAAADEHRAMTVVTYRGLDRVDVALQTALTKAKLERVFAAMPLAGSSRDVSWSVPFGVHHAGADDLPVDPNALHMLTDWYEVGDGHGHATAVTSPDFGSFALGRPDTNLMTDYSAVPDKPWFFPVVVDTDAGSAVDIGTYTARFSIGAGGPGVGAALAASEREPLQAVSLGTRSGPLTGPRGSLLQVSGGRVTAAKAPRVGDGLIVRLVADGGPLTVRPDPALHLGAPTLATVDERPLGGAVGIVQAVHEQIVTLRFPPARGGSVTPASVQGERVVAPATAGRPPDAPPPSSDAGRGTAANAATGVLAMTGFAALLALLLAGVALVVFGRRLERATRKETG